MKNLLYGVFDVKTLNAIIKRTVFFYVITETEKPGVFHKTVHSQVAKRRGLETERIKKT